MRAATAWARSCLQRAIDKGVQIDIADGGVVTHERLFNASWLGGGNRLGSSAIFQQAAKPFAGPRQPRHHRANGYAQFLGNFAIAQILQTDQQQDLSVFQVQGIHGAHKVMAGAARGRNAQIVMLANFHDVLF